MVEREDNTLRAIAWFEVFPWLRLIRVFRVSISVHALVLAAVGVLLTAVGWAFVGGVFYAESPTTKWLQPYCGGCPWEVVTSAVPNQPGGLAPQRCEFPWKQPFPQQQGWVEGNPFVLSWTVLTQPAWEGLSHTDTCFNAIVSLVLCGLWGTAVWALFGAAICRTAAVQLAAHEQVGAAAAVRFAVRKWPAFFAAPLFPIGGVLVAAIPVFVLGLLMRLLGLWLGAIFWPFALVAGFLMAVLLLGLLFGWPLMWATISTEGTDSFDALSRSYAYVFQRPLHYLFYILVAGFIGWLGWIFVQNFASGIVWMSYWAAGWGTGNEVLQKLLGVGEETGGFGPVMIRFWAGCVKLLAVGFLFSYFWSSAAGIYLLLRRDVDATETDEVFLDADVSEQTYGLPTVAADASGAPVTEDDPSEDDAPGTTGVQPQAE